MKCISFEKIKVLIFATLLLLSTIVSVRSVNLVFANGIPAPPINNVYIRSNGTIEPSTTPISHDGNTYVLTGNIANASLIVQRDNIVIDGAGYGIHGYSRSYYDGIIISYRTNITIKNVDISPFGYGVRMDYASNNTITGNRMSVFTGVSLLYSDYNQIIGNVITDGYGVQGLGSNNLISGNNFTSGLDGGGNGMGIYVTGNYNVISQNFMQEELSIQLPQSMFNTISNNTIVNGRTGILLGRSSNNLVFGNIIRGKIDARSGALGISSDCYNNTVYGNQFENNALAISLGIQIADFIYNNVSGNRFYLNNFINNSQNVWIASGTPVNFWDNGNKGNYWSNYDGRDMNGDGIGDTPYVINGNNTDNRPLIKSALISEVFNSENQPSMPNQDSSSTPASSPSESDSSSTPSESPAPSKSPDQNPSPNPSPSQSDGEKESTTTVKPEPFPTMIIVSACVVSAFLLCAGLILIFRRRNRKLKNADS